MQIELLAPQTAGATIAPQNCQAYHRVTFVASNLATTETVTVGIQLPGNVVIPALSTDGSAAGLSATNPTRTYYGGADYVLVKSGTAGACGVYLVPVAGTL